MLFIGLIVGIVLVCCNDAGVLNKKYDYKIDNDSIVINYQLNQNDTINNDSIYIIK